MFRWHCSLAQDTIAKLQMEHTQLNQLLSKSGQDLQAQRKAIEADRQSLEQRFSEARAKYGRSSCCDPPSDPCRRRVPRVVCA